MATNGGGVRRVILDDSSDSDAGFSDIQSIWKTPKPVIPKRIVLGCGLDDDDSDDGSVDRCLQMLSGVSKVKNEPLFCKSNDRKPVSANAANIFSVDSSDESVVGTPDHASHSEKKKIPVVKSVKAEAVFRKSTERKPPPPKATKILSSDSPDDSLVDTSVESPLADTKANVDVKNDDADPSAWRCDKTRNEYYLKSLDRTVWPVVRIPAEIFEKLYEFQVTGVQWMASLHENRIGGILGDDMGMGKTFMTLTYLGGLMRSETIRNALIIAPVSVLRSWKREASKTLSICAPNVSIQVVNSNLSFKQRKIVLTKALKCTSMHPHVVISTYGMVRCLTNDFVRTGHFDYVCLDEGHVIKNQATETAKACRTICGNENTRRLMLTGTPILNHLYELWALIDWATSGLILGDRRQFGFEYNNPIEGARQKNASEAMITIGQEKNTDLQEVLRPFFLQRLKIDFLGDKLPGKHELIVWTHISSKQRTLYQEYINEKHGLVEKILFGKGSSPLEAISFLKKLCGHPLLTETARDQVQFAVQQKSGAELMAESAKLRLLVSLLEDFTREGHKTLIFSQSTKMLDIIEKTLEGYAMGRIDGSTPEAIRQDIVDNFNAEGSEIDLMLLSTKAAGVGLTLNGADRVVIYDPSWTPAEDNQAVDRCYRIGQDKSVLVYRLIAAGTVEEKMYERQVYKDGIRRAVCTDGRPVQRYFDRAELKRLFALGPPGECELMEKAKEEMARMDCSWIEQDGVLKHESAVGVTRHDGFYLAAAEDHSPDSNTPFGGKDAHSDIVWRSKEVLAEQDLNVLSIEDVEPSSSKKRDGDAKPARRSKSPRITYASSDSPLDGGKASSFNLDTKMPARIHARVYADSSLNVDGKYASDFVDLSTENEDGINASDVVDLSTEHEGGINASDVVDLSMWHEDGSSVIDFSMENDDHYIISVEDQQDLRTSHAAIIGASTPPSLQDSPLQPMLLGEPKAASSPSSPQRPIVLNAQAPANLSSNAGQPNFLSDDERDEDRSDTTGQLNNLIDAMSVKPEPAVSSACEFNVALSGDIKRESKNSALADAGSYNNGDISRGSEKENVEADLTNAAVTPEKTSFASAVFKEADRLVAIKCPRRAFNALVHALESDSAHFSVLEKEELDSRIAKLLSTL